MRGIINRHIKNIIYIFIVKSHFENLFFKTFPVTGFTFQMNIRHKLHFDGNFAITLTGFTSSAVNIKRKMFRLDNLLILINF